MNFLPTLQILSTDDGVIVKQHLAEDDVGRVHHAHVQRRQALAVLVVRTRAQLQKGPEKQNNVLFVMIFCDINVIKFFFDSF